MIERELELKQENGSVTFTSRVVFVHLNFNHQFRMSEHPDLVGILPILLENPESQPVCDRDRKNPDFDICFDKYTRRPKGLCNNYQEGGRG